MLIKVDLPKLFRQRRRVRSHPAILRPIGPSLSAELQLYRYAAKILDHAFKLVRDRGVPLASELKQQLIVDSAADGIGAFMRMLISLLRNEIDDLERNVSVLFRQEERRHRTSFEAAVRNATAIELGPVLQAADVSVNIDTAMTRSVGLIRGLTDETAKRVQTVLLNAAEQGWRSTDLAKELQKQFGWSKSRARLIARDQLATFNGTLNRIRQQQVGIDKYQWNTSLDERVRPEHAMREGRVYRWDSPPADGHPGEPINCRCVAKAIVDLG